MGWGKVGWGGAGDGVKIGMGRGGRWGGGGPAPKTDHLESQNSRPSKNRAPRAPKLPPFKKTTTSSPGRRKLLLKTLVLTTK